MKRLIVWIVLAVVLVVVLVVLLQLFGLTMHGSSSASAASRHPSPRRQKHIHLVAHSSGPKKAGRVSERHGWRCSSVTSLNGAYVYGYSAKVYEIRLRGHWCWNGKHVKDVHFTRSYWSAPWSIWDFHTWQQPVRGGGRTYRYAREASVWRACIPHTPWCAKTYPTVSLTLRADGTMKAGSS